MRVPKNAFLLTISRHFHKEFVRIMTLRVKLAFSYSEIIDSFDIIKDSNGSKKGIHMNDIVKFLTSYCSVELGKMSEKRARQLVLQMGPDQAGLVNYHVSLTFDANLMLP